MMMRQFFSRCLQVSTVLLVWAVGFPSAGQTLIPASGAQTLTLPSVPGDGVFVEVFNGIGGGPAPLPANLAGRVPTGVTNSPFVWFPNPGPIINVGQSFATFFANTTTPPNTLTTTPALNFIMRITGTVRIESAMDRDPVTPGIQLALSVGSDDGFHLTMAGVFLGQGGDRSFQWTDMNITVEQPGLYPYTLLFSANAVGQSGLQFAWITQQTGNTRQVIPQARLYRNINECVEQFTFDDLAAGTSDFSTYLSRGLVVQTSNPDIRATNTRPTRFVPITSPHVLADTRVDPPVAGVVTLQFRDTIGNPGFVNYCEGFVINATGPGAVVRAFNATGAVVSDQTIVTDGAGQQRFVIAAPFVTRVEVDLGTGVNNAALDSLCIGAVESAQFIDLRVTQLVPESAVVGRPVSVPYTYENAGQLATAGPFANALFLTPVGGSPSQVAVTEDAGVPALGAGQSRDRVFAFTPGQVGDFTLRARVDSGGTQVEGPFESNNDSAETSFSVINSADLQVAGGSITAAPQLLGGSTVQIGYAVVNAATAGSASASGLAVERIYLSSDGVLGGGDEVLLSETSGSVTLAPGETAARTVNVQVPALNQQMFIIVQVNATDSIYEFGPASSNNTAAAGPVQVNTADLGVTSVAPPANATFGSTMQVDYTVTNQGGAATATGWSDRVFLSVDAAFSADDLPLNPVNTVAGTLAPTGTLTLRATVNLPVRVTSGTFFVLVRTDDANAVLEVNEANNVRASVGAISIAGSPAPNLAAETVTVPVSAQWGQPLTVAYVASNAGSAASTAGYVDGIYVNTQPSLAGATRVGQVPGIVLAPGTAQPREVTVITPANFSGNGSYFILVRVDDSQQQLDINPGNNVSASGAVQFSATPSVDFTATGISGPATADDGQPVSVTWTVQNVGTRGATPQWGDRIYLSPTPAFSAATAQSLGDFVRSASLSAGASYTRTEQVTIPAGLSGNRWLVIQANVGATVPEPLGVANNIAVSSTPINIVQGQLPDLAVSQINFGSEVYVGRPTSVSYVARNAGPGTANGAWRDRVYFGPHNATNPTSIEGLTLLTEPRVISAIAPNAVYGNSASLVLPTAPGRYRVVVLLDALTQIDQTTRENDIAVQTIDVIAPEYTAVASTDFTQGTFGSPVLITGQATRAEGGPAINVPVKVHVVVRGARRVLSVVTNASGGFSTTFTPLPTEAGVYSIFATHPAQNDIPPQDSFTLHGMLGQPARVDLRVTPGEASAATFTIRNPGDLPLTGVGVQVSGAPSGVTIDAVVPPTIPAQGEVSLAVNVAADLGTTGQSFALLTLSSAQGASATATLALELAPPAAQLVASPSPVTVGMVRGGLTPVTITVRNTGGRASGPISVASSAAQWLSQVTPASLPPLGPGETLDVNLSLSPPASLPLGPYTGAVLVSTTGQSLTIPFTFTNVSTSRGTLEVRAEDEFTYFAAGNPPLAGATIEVRDRATGAVVASAMTGVDGVVRFEDLLEAEYTITANAPDHGSATTSLVLAPGTLNRATVFLARRLVSYEWTVTPTSIQDVYNINISATFQTNVPLPVVTIEPAFVDLRDLTEGTRQVDFTIRNNGLIAARDVALQFAGNEDVNVSPLLDTIGELPANSQIVVPVTFTANSRRGSGGCLGIALAVRHVIICGVPRQYLVPVAFGLNQPNCPGGGVYGGWVGGSSSSGGGVPALSGPPPANQPVVCDPCDFKCAQAVFNCVVPGPIGCGLGLLEGCLGVNPIFGTDPGSGPTGLGCIWSGVTCISDIAGNLDCGYNLFCNCLCQWGGAPGGLVSFRDTVCGSGRADPWAQFQQLPTAGISDAQLLQFTQSINRFRAIAHTTARAFGDPAWLQVRSTPVSLQFIAALQSAITVASDGGTRITGSELAAAITAGVPAPLSTAQVEEFSARWNRSVDYYAAGIFNVTDVPAGQSTDFFARDVIEPIRDVARAAVLAEQSAGYASAGDSLFEARQLLQTNQLEQDTGVCAKVRIEINQEAVLTREAFNATLRITNNDQVGSLTSVGASIRVTDANGLDATGRFLVQPPTLSGINDIAGAGVLGAQGVGSATWIIVPRHTAAPAQPAIYYVSGSFQYVPPSGGAPVTVPLFPTAITVRPNPSLSLKYFLERVVYSNDPFTAEVEPAVPYSLGLLVTNTGGGAARDLQLTTSQPRIVENARGLLIDFNIIGTLLNNQGLNPSLTVNFGDLGPGATSVAQFIMTSSLQGEFSDFAATFSNRNGLGDPSVSLIDSVSVHSLTHVVRSTREGSDTLPDFLVDDVPDTNNLPDTVHLSDGTTAPVLAVANPVVQVDGANLAVQVTVPSMPINGFAYVQFTNPFAALQATPLSASRQDGVALLTPQNLWLTSRIVRRENQPPVPENLVRLFDFGGPGVYTIRFRLPSASPALTAWRIASDHGEAGTRLIAVTADGLSTEPRIAGVREMRVLFGAPVIASTFSASSISLSGLQGQDSQPVNLSDITMQTTLTDNDTVGIVTFSQPLPDRARYCLSLVGVRNFLDEPASENGQVSFTTLAGDVLGDRRVNNTDVGAVVALQGVALSADPSEDQVRADVTGDGVINGADLSAVLARRRTETRFIAAPCPAPLGSQPADGLAGAYPRSAWTAGPQRAPQTTSEWYSRELSADDRLYLQGEGATSAYAAAGAVVPLRIDTSRIAVRLTSQGSAMETRLRQAGLDVRSLNPTNVDGWYQVAPTHELHPARIREFIAQVQRGGLQAAPIYREPDGSWRIPTSAVLASVRVGQDGSSVFEQAGLRVAERDVMGMVGMLRLEAVTANTSGLDTLTAANRLASHPTMLWAEPVWVMSIARGMEARTALPLAAPLHAAPAISPATPLVALLDDGGEAERLDVFASPVVDATGSTRVPLKSGGVYGTLAGGVVASNGISAVPVRVCVPTSSGFAASTMWLIRGLEAARQAGARVTLTGASTATLSDGLAWAYARTRDDGMLHVAPAGDVPAHNAIARLPAVLSVGATDALGQPANFSLPGPRVAFSSSGVAVPTADLRARAGLAPGDQVRVDGTLLAAARVAELAGRVALRTNHGDPAVWERSLRGATLNNWTPELGLGTVDDKVALALAQEPGDINTDGVVDHADLVLLMQHVVVGAFAWHCDLNDDGAVDLDDVEVWKGQ